MIAGGVHRRPLLLTTLPLRFICISVAVNGVASKTMSLLLLYMCVPLICLISAETQLSSNRHLLCETYVFSKIPRQRGISLVTN